MIRKSECITAEVGVGAPGAGAAWRGAPKPAAQYKTRRGGGVTWPLSPQRFRSFPVWWWESGSACGSGDMDGLVITGGRVVDPASGMDAIGDVAVLDGQIAAVGSGLGSAERSIDATGLVVAPGFIDLHAHGQSIPADRMQAFDGVTTTLDLEAGVLPVASWYRRQAAKGRVLNYGAAANWAFARIGAMTGSNTESSLEAFGNAMRDRRWIENVASDPEVAGILERLANRLNEGGIGIGILNAYAPGAGVQELTAVCQLAAAQDVPTFTHVAYMSRVEL